MVVGSKESTGRVAGKAFRPPVKERLLRVATRLFARHGFEGTSVQDIVDAAGVTKGAMYHYYGSKDDLLYEVYHQLLTMQTSHLDEIVAGPGTAEERLRAAAVATGRLRTAPSPAWLPGPGCCRPPRPASRRLAVPREPHGADRGAGHAGPAMRGRPAELTARSLRA